MDYSLVSRIHFPITSLDHPLCVTENREKIQFNLIPFPEFPVVLYYLWLLYHSPHINWSTGTVVKWGPSCKSSCLLSRAKLPDLKPSSLEDAVCSEDMLEQHLSSMIWVRFFARRGPLHCLPIDLLVVLLIFCQEPLFHNESFSCHHLRLKQWTYIKDSLATGIIRPSSSFAGAGIFLFGKKDGGLRPFIDYRRLKKLLWETIIPCPWCILLLNYFKVQPFLPSWISITSTILWRFVRPLCLTREM